MTIQNKQLLRDAIEFARRSAEGEEILVNGIKSMWNQESYASVIDGKSGDPHTCGTAYCIAGYIVAQHPTYEAKLVKTTEGDIDLEAKIDGEPISGYGNIAIRMLGLNPYSSESDNFWRLFDGENTLEDVEYIASQLLGEDI